MSDFMREIATVAMGIIGVAVVAVIVSRNSQSPAVIQSAGSAFSNALDVAISPVTGNSATPNLTYPTSGFGFGGVL